MDKSGETEQTKPVVEFERKINDEAFEIASWVSLLKTMQELGQNEKFAQMFFGEGDQALKVLCLKLEEKDYESFLGNIKRYAIKPSTTNGSVPNYEMADIMGLIDEDGPRKEVVYALTYLTADNEEDMNYLNQDYALDKLNPYIDEVAVAGAASANNHIMQQGNDLNLTYMLDSTRTNAKYYIEEYFHQDNS